MLKKTEKLVITFYTTTAAMAMESVCKAKKLDGRLIPVPGTITADCGLAWCARTEAEGALKAAMEETKIAFQGIYRCLI